MALTQCGGKGRENIPAFFLQNARSEAFGAALDNEPAVS
jgi:hypothetical protein